MKKQVLFIHSAGAQGVHEGSSDLVAYLRNALGSDYDVLYPKMAAPERPEYASWKKQLEKEFSNANNEIIIVGHSLGGSVLLKYFSEEEFQKNIAGLFLIAVPFWGTKNWEIDEYVLPNNFSSRIPFIPKVYLYHSRDDEVVSFAHMEQYLENLPHSVVRILPDRDHAFNNGIPELVNDIKNLDIII